MTPRDTVKKTFKVMFLGYSSGLLTRSKKITMEKFVVLLRFVVDGEKEKRKLLVKRLLRLVPKGSIHSAGELHRRWLHAAPGEPLRP